MRITRKTVVEGCLVWWYMWSSSYGMEVAQGTKTTLSSAVLLSVLHWSDHYCDCSLPISCLGSTSRCSVLVIC